MAAKKSKGRSTPSRSTNPRTVVAQARTRSRRPATIPWDLLRSIAWAVALFLVLRTFVVEAYHIPSGSMEPTLLVGDFLFVNKVLYGPHVPFTHAHIPGFRDPRRGEIVVYQSPSQVRLRPELRVDGDLTPIVVKRLVAVGGDTIYMRDGMLYVNGIAQRPGFGIGEKPLGWTDSPDPSFDWQKAYALASSRFGPAPAQPTHDDWGPMVVPPNHYFSLGDNRYNSVDARYYGFIPRDNIRGHPMFIYMSVDFDDWRIRWDRIFMGIH